jgi:hypothetical protein
MVLMDNLPTDSVLRRHAITERERELGLPPTDSVLRRHYEQLMGLLQGDAAQPGAPARPATAGAPLRAAAAQPARAAAAPSSGGGLFGWLRRLLGL